MNIFQSIKTCFKKSFTFKGRASRSEFWWFLLSQQILFFIVGIFQGVADTMPVENLHFTIRIIFGLTALATLLSVFSGISVSVRRLHDTNHSGWWWWSWFTIIGIIPLFYWGIKKGDSSANQYGNSPLKDC
jgi:uncharacterized membrane protein YhaH (DUF805 family)